MSSRLHRGTLQRYFDCCWWGCARLVVVIWHGGGRRWLWLSVKWKVVHVDASQQTCINNMSQLFKFRDVVTPWHNHWRFPGNPNATKQTRTKRMQRCSFVVSPHFFPIVYFFLFISFYVAHPSVFLCLFNLSNFIVFSIFKTCIQLYRNTIVFYHKLKYEGTDRSWGATIDE